MSRSQRIRPRRNPSDIRASTDAKEGSIVLTSEHGRLVMHIGNPESVSEIVYDLGEGFSGLADYLESNGYGVLQRRTRIAYIQNLRIESGARGSGSGSALLRAALEIARSADVSLVFLHAKPEDDQHYISLIRFYTRAGFGEFNAGDEGDFNAMYLPLKEGIEL